MRRITHAAHCPLGAGPDHPRQPPPKAKSWPASSTGSASLTGPAPLQSSAPPPLPPVPAPCSSLLLLRQGLPLRHGANDGFHELHLLLSQCNGIDLRWAGAGAECSLLGERAGPRVQALSGEQKAASSRQRVGSVRCRAGRSGQRGGSWQRSPPCWSMSNLPPLLVSQID